MTKKKIGSLKAAKNKESREGYALFAFLQAQH
jgi:hypothetical protein